MTQIATDKTNKPAKPTGYVLYEADELVVIATLESANDKTGDMVQVWILPRKVNPWTAVKTGMDSIVCLDCMHRGTSYQDRTCYVLVYNAPYSIWEKYNAGGYEYLPVEEYSEIFSGRKIRLGAYGEPVLIPLGIVEALIAASAGWTGYTHQWRKAEYAAYKAYIMASVDRESEYHLAKADGWRTFRVRTEEAPILSREITCPASDEAGKRTQCERCLLCSGSTAADPRKDITIIVHGKKKPELFQIAIAA